jgi:iron-sulfur cluster assembly protein
MVSTSILAAEKVNRQLTKRGKGIGIRVGVKTTGCSGLAYTLEYVDIVDNNDLVFESNELKIFVDPKSIVYIDGMLIEWKRNGLNEGFEFINKNERDRCGCGESFRI